MSRHRSMDDAFTLAGERARNRLDGLVAKARVPGVEYVVLAPDGILFEHYAGWADIAGGRKVNGATTMMGYSMTKPITAAAVLKLVQAEHLALDDRIGAYLPSCPYGAAITVRQLLSHTAGIPNPVPLRWVHRAALHDAFDERAALGAVLHTHRTLSFAPGTKYGYSNIGYWLVGCIVERVSGTPFKSYVRDFVLQPLGIASSDLDFTVPCWRNHAKGYLEKYSLMNAAKRFLLPSDLIGAYEGPWLHINDHYVDGAAFGGLVGNARGFGKFLQDQIRPRSAIFNDHTRTLFHSPVCSQRGVAKISALGWEIGAVNGTACIYKVGGGGGFHSIMRAYLSKGIATVLMTNATGLNVASCLDAIDAPFLATGRK